MKSSARISMLSILLLAFATASIISVPIQSAHAADPQAPSVRTSPSKDTFTEQEVLNAATGFFGSTSKGMADVVHKVFSDYGQPNAYIAGEEGGGAFVLGLRYGGGTLVMKNGEREKVFWQGPTAGWDFGGNAVKVFTLIYNLPNGKAIYQRFAGVEGSAYFIGGIGLNYQQRGNIVLAPMRSGVGLRLGASVGYLKYTEGREWLPF